MDTLTHALSGALLARATAPAESCDEALPFARRMAVGFLAAAFPDLDFIASYVSPIAYLHYHRGITHSWLMLPVWAVLLGLLFARGLRDAPRWRLYAAVAAWSIAIHIVGDWITSYGTMMFAPLSDTRYELSTTFIVDLWFSGIILAGLAGAWLWRRTRAPAVAGLCALTAYVAFQFVLRDEAIAVGVDYARAHRVHASEIKALPRPVSPFNWMIVVVEEHRYLYALVNLVRRNGIDVRPGHAGFFERLDAPYVPVREARWLAVDRYGSNPADAALAQEAYRQPAFHFFRWFALYPAAFRVDHDAREPCAWFEDLRFLTPGRSEVPFRYGMCREGGSWQPFRLEDERRVPAY